MGIVREVPEWGGRTVDDDDEDEDEGKTRAMGVSQSQSNIELPASVRAQLGRFRRGLWWMETAVAVLGGCCGLLAAYLLLFVSDRFWETPQWLRVGLAVSSAVCWAGFVGYWLDRWGWHRRDARQLAALVQKRYPRLGDRLLGIVELADAARRPAVVSPALCRAAMQQVAAEAASLDFREAVPRRRRRTWGLAFVGLLGVVAAGGVWLPSAALNAWQRLRHPIAAIGRYTLVHLLPGPRHQIVPYGEAFAVRIRLADDSRWFPSWARCRYQDQQPLVSAVAGREVGFQVPGQTRAGTLAFEVGDARAQMEIQPTFRPDLVRLRAAIEWPSYLGYAPATQDVRDGTVELLEGSRVTFQGQVSRALAQATLGMEQLRVAADRFTAPAQVMTNAQTVALAWQDVLGLTGREPLALKIEVRKDEAPVVDCRGIDRVVAMLEDEVLEIEVAATDDFGVRATGLTWEAAGNPSLGVAATNGTLAVRQGGQQQKELVGRVRFAPLALGLGPQQVTLRAMATDYLPGRQPAVSAPRQIYVLDRLEHAKLVQQQFEKLQAKLEEIARAEENLFELNQRLREELARPETATRLPEQERAEEANAEALRRLQAEARALLKEALRNKMIDEAALRQWARLLEKLPPLSEEEMPQVARSLGAAAPVSPQRAGHMNAALTRQQQVVSELRQALQQMNRAGEQLLAANFVNRFRQAAAAETGIGGDLTRLVPESIGLTAGQLSDPVKRRVDEIEQQQRRNQRQVKYIEDDLEHFFSRTRQNLFGNVQQEMVKTRIVEQLEQLVGLIDQNASGQAITQANHWADQLEQWAKRLAPAKDGGGGDGSGGGGEMSAAALDLLLKLMRVRLAEEGVRDQTRFLDEHREGNGQYAPGTQGLARIQQALQETIARMADGTLNPQLEQLLGDVGGAMKDAAALLGKPQTDGETIAAETEAIELLAAAMENAAGGANARGGAGLMAMLRSLLGRGAGRQGTGSDQGGDTAKLNLRLRGSDPAGAAERRPVEKAGGRDRATFPAEFRDAIEAYLDAVGRAK